METSQKSKIKFQKKIENIACQVLLRWTITFNDTYEEKYDDSEKSLMPKINVF
jgi:hypothetical protein